LAPSILAPCHSEPAWQDNGQTLADSSAIAMFAPYGSGYVVATTQGIYYTASATDRYPVQLFDKPCRKLQVVGQQIFALCNVAHWKQTPRYKLYRAVDGQQFLPVRKNYRIPDFDFTVNAARDTFYIASRCSNYGCMVALPFSHQTDDWIDTYLSSGPAYGKLPLYHLALGGNGSLLTFRPGHGMFIARDYGRSWRWVEESGVFKRYQTVPRFFADPMQGEIFFTLKEHATSKNQASFAVIPGAGLRALKVAACGIDYSRLTLYGITHGGTLYGYDTQTHTVVLIQDRGRGEVTTYKQPFEGDIHIAGIQIDETKGELVIAINEMHLVKDQYQANPLRASIALYSYQMRSGWLMSISL
ncbi:MAG: hypothetical protein AAF840_06460, partial [Bacteroidota bacterium]